MPNENSFAICVLSLLLFAACSGGGATAPPTFPDGDIPPTSDGDTTHTDGDGVLDGDAIPDGDGAIDGDAITDGDVTADGDADDDSYADACWAEFQWDQTLERGCDALQYYDYSDDGMTVSLNWDDDCDGSPDTQCLRETFDAQGNIVFSGTDKDCDGALDACQTYVFDTQNRVISERLERNCDGVGDCTTHEYTEDGLVSKTTTNRGCDDLVERCEVYDYSESGQPLKITTFEPCGGEATRCKILSYDDADRLLYSYLDDACDGGKDSACTEYRYNQDGLKIFSGTDENCDGTFDRNCVTREILDENGLELWKASSSNCAERVQCSFIKTSADGLIKEIASDPDCTGMPDKKTNCSYSQYDQDGNPIFTYRDKDCQGEPESLCRAYAYNDYGDYTYQSTDHDCDGVPDYDCRRWSYDDYGNERYYERSQDCSEDGYQREWEYDYSDDDPPRPTLYRHYTSTFKSDCEMTLYDAEGRVILEAEDKTCTGTVYSECKRTMYDADGDISRVFTDLDCDGEPDVSCSSWTRDSGTHIKMSDLDCAGTESQPQCDRESYDERGNLLSEGQDDDCDGVYDRECTFKSYDSANNVIEEVKDPSCDGSNITERRRWTYDSQNRIHTELYFEGGKEIPDLCTTYEYRQDGKLHRKFLSRHTCLTQATQVGQLQCTTYVYDASGNLIREEFDANCIGAASTCKIYSYDANGNKTAEGLDDDCDGVMDDDCTLWQYDENGHLSHQTQKACDDWEHRMCHIFGFDEDGREILRATDDGCDGVMDDDPVWFEQWVYSDDGALNRYCSSDHNSSFNAPASKKRCTFYNEASHSCE